MERPDTTYSIQYTDKIVRDAVKTFVLERGFASQKKIWLAEITLSAMFIWALACGERGWSVGVMGATLLVLPSLIGLIWLAHYRNTVGKFHAMVSPVADITIATGGLSLRSELGSALIPWTRLTEIWERPTYWMIFTDVSQFFTLPIETIAENDREFIRSKVGRPPSP